MKKFVNKLRSENGYTLVELIAAISLASIIAGIIFTTITFGVNSYQKIQIENELRDEADLVMSTVISELYTFSPKEIEKFDDGDQHGIKLSSGPDIRKLYIEKNSISSTGTLYINGKEFDIRSNIVIDDLDETKTSSISIKCGSTSVYEGKCSTGMINIRLTLSQEQGGHIGQLTLDSKFGF